MDFTQYAVTFIVSCICRLSFDPCYSLISTNPVKGGAYNWLEYLMYKLKDDCFIGHDTRILMYKYLCIYKYSLL